jgi:hypothetical protein
VGKHDFNLGIDLHLSNFSSLFVEKNILEFTKTSKNPINISMLKYMRFFNVKENILERGII